LQHRNYTRQNGASRNQASVVPAISPAGTTVFFIVIRRLPLIIFSDSWPEQIAGPATPAALQTHFIYTPLSLEISELFVTPSLQIIEQRETPFWFSSGTQKAAIYDLIAEVTSLQRLANPVPVIYVSITFIGTLDISITNTSGPKTLRIYGMQEWSKFN